MINRQIKLTIDKFKKTNIISQISHDISFRESVLFTCGIEVRIIKHILTMKGGDRKAKNNNLCMVGNPILNY